MTKITSMPIRYLSDHESRYKRWPSDWATPIVCCPCVPPHTSVAPSASGPNLTSIHLAVSRLQVFWPRALLVAPGSQSEGPSALLFAPGNQSDGPAPQLFSPACLRQISSSAFVTNLFQLTVLDPNLDFSTPSNNSATPFTRPPHFNLNKAELQKANSYGRRGL